MRKKSTKQATKTDIINRCIDILKDSNIDLLDIAFNRVIDILSDYPKPRQKGDEKEPNPAILGAYLHVSNARNVVNLGLLKFYPETQAGTLCFYNLKEALTLLENE